MTGPTGTVRRDSPRRLPPRARGQSLPPSPGQTARLTRIVGTDPDFRATSGSAKHFLAAKQRRWMTVIAAICFAVTGCAACDDEATPPVPADAVSVAEALRQQPRHVVVVRGYLTAPFDDVDRLCPSDSHDYATCRNGVGLVVERLDAAAYPGLKEGPGTAGFFSTHEVPIRGVVRGTHLIADPAESLRGCRTGMKLWLRSAQDTHAVGRVVRSRHDVRSVRLVTDQVSSAPRRPYFVIRPASAAAARGAAHAGAIVFISCEVEHK